MRDEGRLQALIVQSSFMTVNFFGDSVDSEESLLTKEAFGDIVFREREQLAWCMRPGFEPALTG